MASLENGDLEEINLEDFDNTKRTLVLYCRHYQISPVDFTVIARTLQEYVAREYSKVFNDIVIVSRDPGVYYEEYVSPFYYKDVTGKDFEETCSIFANEIHFTHGTPVAHKYGSRSILSASVRGDRDKMKGVHSFVPLYLKLDPRGEVLTPHGEKLFDGDIVATAEEALRAVRELEDKMLSEINNKK